MSRRYCRPRKTPTTPSCWTWTTGRGPGPRANDWLYTEDGLWAAFTALRPGGVLAVWSGRPRPRLPHAPAQDRLRGRRNRIRVQAPGCGSPTPSGSLGGPREPGGPRPGPPPVGTSRYLLTETDASRLPVCSAEVAFIGRSNVGKSS